MRAATGASLILFLLVTQSWAQDKGLKISGFSDITFENRSGDVADEEDLQLFEDGGGEEELIEAGSRVTTPGFNLNLLGTLSESLIFQGEVAFSFEDEDFEIELLRSYIDYRIDPKFNLQAGKFLSSVGYLNRNQRSYSFLNYSVKARDLVNKEFGYLPSFTVGLKAYGSFELGNTSALSYHVAYGGMRGLYPEAGETISGFEFAEDESNSGGTSLLLEYLTFIGNKELIVGLSGYRVPRIVGFSVEDGEDVEIGEEADELEEAGLLIREEMELSEMGFAPYLRLDGPKFQVMFEYHLTHFEDQIGNLDNSDLHYSAYSLEFVYKTQLFGKPFYPYIRNDYRKIDDDHHYYGLEVEGEEELVNAHVPNSKEVIFGFAYDVVSNNRIKMEYGRFLSGPYPENSFRVSTSFAF